MHAYFQNKKGFTLVETLVAITVLLLVIIGPMTIAQKGIQNAYYAKDQVTAVFLAQEAVEGIRQLRDEKGLAAYSGNASIDTASWVPSCDSGCAYNAANGTFTTCGTANNYCKLSIDSTTGEYTHTAGGNALSPFTRTVTVGAAVGGGVPVTVDVTWNARVLNNSTRDVKLQTWIYDHYQRYEN